MTMKLDLYTGIFVLAAVSVCSVSIADGSSADQAIGDAIIAGTPHVSFRYRFSKDANASTLRLRLNYEIRQWRHWSGFAEFDFIAEPGVNNFNSGAGTSSVARSQYPVVADPKGADLDQLFVDYSGRYVQLGGSWTFSSALTLAFGYESLSGDQSIAGYAFRTPLATLHAFQGWADQFLTTPAAGIDDLSVGLSYKFGSWNIAAYYHDYSAEAGAGAGGSVLESSNCATFAFI